VRFEADHTWQIKGCRADIAPEKILKDAIHFFFGGFFPLGSVGGFSASRRKLAWSSMGVLWLTVQILTYII